MTADEVAAVREAEAVSWWEAQFPGRDMPQVDVIEEVADEERMARMSECLEEAAIPGVTVLGPGEWTFNYVASDDTAGHSAQEMWWICAKQYPVRLADTVMMSDRQLEWLFDFYDTRYRPCLAFHGFEALDFPDRHTFLHDSIGFPMWYPMDQRLSPVPTPAEWRILAMQCPVPDILEPYVGPVE